MGLWADGVVFLRLNTTSAVKNLALTLPATPPAAPTVVPLTLAPESFGLLISGEVAFRLPGSSETDPALFYLVGALSMEVSPSELAVLAVATFIVGTPADPWFAFNANGLLVVNDHGFAAQLTLSYTNNTLPGVALNANFLLVTNTTGQLVQYEIPDFEAPIPDIPPVLGPDLAPMEEVGPNGERLLTVPAAPPAGVPVAPGPYVLIFGQGSLTLLDTVEPERLHVLHPFRLLSQPERGHEPGSGAGWPHPGQRRPADRLLRPGRGTGRGRGSRRGDAKRPRLPPDGQCRGRGQHARQGRA